MRLLVFISLFVICAPVYVSGIEVDFIADATAQSDMLTLGDVAEIRPEKAAEKLNSLVLFPAPQAGELRCYRAGTLMAYVSQAVDEGRRIKWGGAEKVCVGSRGIKIGHENLQKAIDRRLQSALRHLGAEDVSFEMRNPPDAFNLPEGEVEYEVIFGGGRILDARNIAVILRIDGRVVENLRIAGDIKAYLPVVTAARRLNRGDVITKADLVMRRKNIADLGRPFLDFNAADGMVAKRVIPMGHVLEENDLDAPVLVKRREVVTMIAARGNLQVSTRGVAAANGKQGEIISVQNMRSKREVACEVIGRKQVRVEF
jgi:flagella basal body P-ring formation protein FlgA